MSYYRYFCIFGILAVFFVSCNSSHNKFDVLYYNQEYQQAYEFLRANPNPNSLFYREREIKVLLFLALQDTQTYLPLLDNILVQDIPEPLQVWYYLVRSWIRFISAKTTTDYQNIISIIPKEPFSDPNAEQLRLTIQSHSLVQLEQYQEAFAYLNASAITKNSSDLLYLKGITLIKLKQLSEAATAFQNAIAVSSVPRLQSLAYFQLGNLAVQDKLWEQAEEYYLNAWQLNPHQAELNFQLGKALQKKSYRDLHYRFYRASLRLNENLAEAWYHLNI
ncbi:MAG: CDC27 family protein [Brevinema sp.]